MTTVKVKFEMPGVVSIGDYLPGEVYEVDETEAERLISAKGFVRVDQTAAPKNTTKEG